jgi:hypothetical protein
MTFPNPGEIHTPMIGLGVVVVVSILDGAVPPIHE